MLPGVGFNELLVIAVVAILVIGPKDLPRVMRTLGRFIGKARAMARDFQDSFEEIARESEMEEMRKDAENPRAEVSPLSSGPPIPLTPAEEASLIDAHNTKVLEAEAAAMAHVAPADEPTPPPTSDNVTPIRGTRR
jgi:sec-independent protein translocase protein TatB